jgi:hypothetical protein
MLHVTCANTVFRCRYAQIQVQRAGWPKFTRLVVYGQTGGHKAASLDIKNILFSVGYEQATVWHNICLYPNVLSTKGVQIC